MSGMHRAGKKQAAGKLNRRGLQSKLRSAKREFSDKLNTMFNRIPKQKNKSHTEEEITVQTELEARKALKISSNIEKFTPFPLVSYKYDREIEESFVRQPKRFPETEIIVNPYKRTPLCAMALFVTEEPCKAGFTVHGDYEDDYVSGEVSEYKTKHRLPIFGLYPDRMNSVTIHLWGKDGSILDETTIQVKTEALPKKMEHAVKTIKHTVKSAYGLIFISGKNVSLPYAFDSHGIIRYYMNFEMKGYYGLMPLANGRYIIYDRKYLCPTYLLPYCTQIYEGDLFGRFHKVFYLPKGCHHDACEKEPGGNLMLITNSLKKQLGDVVIEVDRNTGEIADQLDFRHILGNAHRDMMGWIHLNTVTYDNKEDTLLICARNLHSVCNIRWKTKKLLWILADPRFWEGTEYESKVLKPDRETSWFYQPHTSYWVSQNQLAVFDNHWHKRRPVPYFDEDPASYVKLFRVDETKHTVSLEHSYRGEKSKITSNPRVEPAKKRVFSMEGTLEPLINGHGGMVYEYDYDTEEVLNQYLIQDYYYRGYEFLPEYDRLAEKMELDQNYVAGFLTRPKEVEHNITIPDQSFSELGAADKKDLIFELSDDTVYIRARDHRIKCVYFVGKNYTYKRDFRKPPQKEPKFRKILYFIAVPLHMMKKDRYQIVVNYRGVMYDTEKYLSVE